MSYATTNDQQYGGSVAASIYDRSTSGLVNLANKYAGNETLSGMAVGSLVDQFRTSGNTAAKIEYDNAFLGSMSKYQQGIENLRKGNTMELLAAETGAQKELITVQAGEQRRQTETEGGQARLNYGVKGDQDRQGYRVQGDENRQAIRVTGDEGRLTQDNQADNTIRLREHAKGSIRQQGQRYYG